MFVLIYHNDNAPNSNATGSEFFGPYNDKQAAQADLTRIVDDLGDQLFQIRDLQPGFAGYKASELEEAGRDPELADQLFAEIVQLTPTLDL